MLIVCSCSVSSVRAMKSLPVLVLLSSALLLCSTAPPLEPLTCSEDSSAAAARLAMHHINQHHDHGYKFRLKEIHGNKVEKVGDGCHIELQLGLLETVCHTVNPKHFEYCDIRGGFELAVKATCIVMVTLKSGEASVTKYECDTQKAKTNEEVARSCPDCPVLIPLNTPEGLKAIHEAVNKFNQNTTNQHYYILQEVGRMKSGYLFSAGTGYFPEFVVVETDCPLGSRISIEACKPLCHDRAHRAFCHASSSSRNGLWSVDCEFYPPSKANHPGMMEPDCSPHGPPAQGHGEGNEVHPLNPNHPCHGSLPNIDPALHPICPWPQPKI